MAWKLGKNSEMMYKVVKAVKYATDKLVIAKLTLNIEDITKIGLAAEKAGADAVSLRGFSVL